MLMPDVNILIYAHREEEKCHEAYAKWLKTLIDGAEPFALSVLVGVGSISCWSEFHDCGNLAVAMTSRRRCRSHDVLGCRLLTCSHI